MSVDIARTARHNATADSGAAASSGDSRTAVDSGTAANAVDSGNSRSQTNAERTAAERDLTFPELAHSLLNVDLAGATRIIAIDGYSGSGKSWFTQRLAQAFNAPVLHLDDYVPGWDKLSQGLATIQREVVQPLFLGEPAHSHRYDWVAAQYAEMTHWQPGGTLLIEGSGAGGISDSLLSTLIWIETAPTVRESRLDAREDYDIYAPYREVWKRHEHELAAAHHTPQRAHLRVTRSTPTHVHFLAQRE